MDPRSRSLPIRQKTPDLVGLYDRTAFPDLAGFPELHGASEMRAPARQPAAVYAVQARLSLRILAKLVDGALAGVLYCLCTLAFDDWFTGFFLGGVLAAFYFSIADSLLSDGGTRRSPGKQLAGLHLARLDRAPVDVGTSVRRNALFASAFFVQAFTFSMPALSLILLGATFVAIGVELWRCTTSSFTCRWGDELAGTEVLEHRVPKPTQRVHVLYAK